ncbi:recombinase family protein [Priestia megaterium]|nr:recombinase family protein [Priestia megaterium]MEB2277328.1 recombinase family protein [Bacillus sp. ILBB4]
MIGYTCVSTTDQNLGRQLSMLKKYGCEKIIEEKFTGTMKDRPGLQTSMNVIQANGFS